MHLFCFNLGVSFCLLSCSARPVKLWKTLPSSKFEKVFPSLLTAHIWQLFIPLHLKLPFSVLSSTIELSVDLARVSFRFLAWRNETNILPSKSLWCLSSTQSIAKQFRRIWYTSSRAGWYVKTNAMRKFSAFLFLSCMICPLSKRLALLISLSTHSPL